VRRCFRLPQVYIIEEPGPRSSGPASTAAPDSPPVNRRQKFLLRAGVLIPLLLLVFTFARGARETRYHPDRVLGVWQTSDRRYADCYMEVTPATIIFGNSQRGYLLYFVSSVQERNDGRQDTFLLHYTDLDGIQ